jgi:hypothetical protein
MVGAKHRFADLRAPLAYGGGSTQLRVPPTLCDTTSRGRVRALRATCSMTPERETSRGLTHDESETNRLGRGGGSRHLGRRGEDAGQERKSRVGERP